jgi:hypothetical protein
MERSFQIFMIGKFGLSNMPLSQFRLLITIDFVTKHAQTYFSSFIHIMYTIS